MGAVSHLGKRCGLLDLDTIHIPRKLICTGLDYSAKLAASPYILIDETDINATHKCPKVSLGKFPLHLHSSVNHGFAKHKRPLLYNTLNRTRVMDNHTVPLDKLRNCQDDSKVLYSIQKCLCSPRRSASERSAPHSGLKLRRTDSALFPGRPDETITRC